MWQAKSIGEINKNKERPRLLWKDKVVKNTRMFGPRMLWIVARYNEKWSKRLEDLQISCRTIIIRLMKESL